MPNPINQVKKFFDYATSERGALSMIFLFALPVLLLLFSAMVLVGFKAQNRFSLQSRLDICASAVVASKIHTLQRLQSINSSLKKLKIAVYAARGLKVLLPEIAMGEAAALQAMHTLELSQWGLIDLAQTKEILLRSCASNSFSKKIAFCSFTPLQRADFFREPTLYADVPGELQWTQRSQKVRCNTISQSSPISAIELEAPLGLSGFFRYVYRE